MTTYGDTLAGWMLDEGSGVGLWTLVVLFLAVLVIVAGVIILTNSVRTATDAV